MAEYFKHITIDRFEALNAARDLLDKEPRATSMAAGINIGDKDWTGVASWTQATELAETGWSAGLEQIYDAGQQMAPSAPATLNGLEIRHDVQGLEPDVCRYLQGDPESMLDYNISQAPDIISLIVPINYMAGTTPRELANRGAAIAALVDHLEQTNRRVEIHAAMLNRGGSATLTSWSWILKRAQDPLCLEELAFWFMHRAALRCIGFCIKDLYGPALNWSRWNYGSTPNTRQALEAQPHYQEYIPDAILIPPLDPDRDYRDPNNALKVVADQLKAAGLNLELENV